MFGVVYSVIPICSPNLVVRENVHSYKLCFSEVLTQYVNVYHLLVRLSARLPFSNIIHRLYFWLKHHMVQFISLIIRSH